MLRRISPIHQQGKASPEQAELMQSLQQAQRSLDHAYLAFDDITDTDLMESCIFEIRSLQARSNYLLRQLKQQERHESALSAANPWFTSSNRTGFISSHTALYASTKLPCLNNSG